MSLKDYQDARTLAYKTLWPFETLIMAAIASGHSGHVAEISKAFPDIYEEYIYRYWSGGGLMPGEEGYDPATDDNLSIELPKKEKHP